MNIMVTGKGGREHALAWALRETEGNRIDNLYIAPGNAGTTEVGENVNIPVEDIPGLAQFAKQHDVNLTIVGPDDQLAAGIVDAFQAQGLTIFGPSQAAAQVESSKSFAKSIMAEQGIPTAAYAAFDNPLAALDYLSSVSFPRFIKADGLALGKGAVPAHNIGEARQIIADMMVDEKLGAAGRRVIIEEHLGGAGTPEISLHALTDGTNYLMFPAAQDHKTIGEGHTGPMTGGMGTVAPLPGISEQVVVQYGERVVAPFLAGLRARGISYSGLLYPGLKLPSGHPKVLEYNARFGDPETQVYMRLVESGLLNTLIACSHGNLSNATLKWRKATAICVVLASAGYPESSQKGVPIEGVNDANQLPGIHVFHAGTAMKDGHLVTNGGRVLNVTAIGADLEEARARAYRAVEQIHFDGMQYRRDIGQRALKGILAI